MQLKLERPVVFFDLETTGVDVAKDRIIEIALLKINPDGSEESMCSKINPGIAIPAETTEIHGITDSDVKDAPSFKEYGTKVKTFLLKCDLGGYNSNKFDIPLLVEEFQRNDIEFDLSGIKAIDVQNIFHKKEERTLSAAYKFYCGLDLKNAHSALADTKATYEILKSQLDKYDDLENDVSFLSDYSNNRKWKALDLVGRIIELNGKPVLNFGKFKHKPLDEVFKSEPGYYSWMMKGDFPHHTKNVLTKYYHEFKEKNPGSGQNSKKKQQKDSPITDDKLAQLKNKFNTK